MTLHGADPETVRTAIETGDPLPGTRGFAGELDGRLLRDVLGRYPLFVDGDSWAFDPGELDDPTLFPAGAVCEPGSESPSEETRWRLPDPEPVNPETALADLQAALEASFAAVDTDGLAVAFSGGVDSALVAAALGVPLYVAGFPDSHDVAAARSGAEALGMDLTVIEVTHDDLRRAVPEVARATRLPYWTAFLSLAASSSGSHCRAARRSATFRVSPATSSSSGNWSAALTTRSSRSGATGSTPAARSVNTSRGSCSGSDPITSRVAPRTVSASVRGSSGALATLA